MLCALGLWNTDLGKILAAIAIICISLAILEWMKINNID